MKYIAFYDTEEYAAEKRRIALCAANVSDYIMDVLSEIENVEVISPTRTSNESGKYPQRKTVIRKGITLVQPKTWGTKTVVGKAVVALYTRFWLFRYLLKNASKNENVVVYHSPAIMTAVMCAKKIKNFKLIIECREVYADARCCYDEFKGTHNVLRKKEYSYFKSADSFIFPSEVLNGIVNKYEKPYVIAPGIYRNAQRVSTKKFDDGKIHVVYAGTMRAAKGLMFVIRTAEFLPSNYHIHILGGANEEIKASIEKETRSLPASEHATVTYEGFMRGEVFNGFLQQCHIGLCPQDPTAVFSNTSFPSKIMTYLSNGLKVISIRIPAVETSPVGEYISYYDTQDAESLAKAIKNVPTEDCFETEKTLNKLHSDLVCATKIMMAK